MPIHTVSYPILMPNLQIYNFTLLFAYIRSKKPELDTKGVGEVIQVKSANTNCLQDSIFLIFFFPKVSWQTKLNKTQNPLHTF